MSAEPMSPERLAAAREVVASGMPMANERAADLLAEVDRLRSDPVRQAEGVTPEDIAAQRAKGWPDFHPEDFCHRCGRPNIQSWFVASPLWNAAIRNEDGTVRDGYPPSEIICPQCFTQADEAMLGGGYRTWELVPERVHGGAALSGEHPEQQT